jgi:hypothetical protein
VSTVKLERGVRSCNSGATVHDDCEPAGLSVNTAENDKI